MENFIVSTFVISVSLMTILNGQAVYNKAYLWPKGIVPYKISSRFNSSEVALIRQGLAEIEKYSCIKFVKRTDQKDYVKYTEYKHTSQENGTCWAGKWGSTKVGYQGGKHTISLWRQMGCFRKFEIVHEMMHILGFVHEQQRGDRDNHIYVDINNIMPEYREYIAKKRNEFTGPDQRITYLETPYDTDSVMHYHAFAFHIDHQRPSMAPRNPCNKLGNEEHLSPLDAIRLNKLYSCPPGKALPPVVKRDLFDYDYIFPVNCSQAAQVGRCESDPLYMNAICGKTCCDRLIGGEVCRDLHSSCPQWAYAGGCEIHKSYMVVHCRKSCRRCS